MMKSLKFGNSQCVRCGQALGAHTVYVDMDYTLP